MRKKREAPPETFRLDKRLHPVYRSNVQGRGILCLLLLPLSLLLAYGASIFSGLICLIVLLAWPVFSWFFWAKPALHAAEQVTVTGEGITRRKWSQKPRFFPHYAIGGIWLYREKITQEDETQQLIVYLRGDTPIVLDAYQLENFCELAHAIRRQNRIFNNHVRGKL